MDVAHHNLQALRGNPYPGRGIVVGLDETGEYLVQVYWIMGRSANSRNRVFKWEDRPGRLYTEAADPAKVSDPSLIMYDAMLDAVPYYIVSNGNQTDTVFDHLQKELRHSLAHCLNGTTYEPDAPNFTQRITATSRICKGGYHFHELSILRKPQLGDACDRATFELVAPRGFGFCITTYAGDGNPLPPFRGDPLLMPLVGDREKIATTYWAALNEANRVALAVKWIEKFNGRSDIHIINQYSQI